MAGKNAVSGYLFILPFIIGFVAFLAYPLIQTVSFAFSRVHLRPAESTFELEWVGGANFNRALFIDVDFVWDLLGELQGMAFIVLPVLVFSLFVAILLNRKFVGRGFVRVIFFLPVILASGVLVGIETNNSLLELVATQIQEQNAMRAGVTGVIEDMMANLVGGAGIGEFFEYVLEVINQIYNIAMASGIQILIFLAGLQTINPSIYEAASIEGATSWESFWKITFPMISPMILVVIVYSIIDYMVRTDSVIMDTIAAQQGVNEFGLGAAFALIYFVVIAVIIGAVGFLVSRLVYYYD